MMEDRIIDDKEKIQILLTEYSSLRAEVDARFSRIYQLTAIGITVGLWLLKQPSETLLSKYENAAFWVILSVLLALVLDVFRGVGRIEKIELRICGTDKTLLNWKTDRLAGRIILAILKVGRKLCRSICRSN